MSESTFDIASFLRALPRVQLRDIPNDDCKCPICLINYLDEDPDTGRAEHPIKLPCSHIIGKSCILQWLKPAPVGGNSNNCPKCRQEFFQPWPASVPSRQDRNINSNDIASLFSAVEEVGYSIGPYLGRFEDPRAHAHKREQIRRKLLANRRQVAVEERNTYSELQSLGFKLPSNIHSPDELLDEYQDQELFEYLQRSGAFRGVSLNASYRVERHGPLKGRILSNAEIWEKLRNHCVWWNIANEWNGRWCTREGWLYPEEDEDDADIFEELDGQGALSTPGVTNYFHDFNNSRHLIYQQILSLGLTWNARRGVWIDRDGKNAFGDTEMVPERVVATPSPRRIERFSRQRAEVTRHSVLDGWF